MTIAQLWVCGLAGLACKAEPLRRAKDVTDEKKLGAWPTSFSPDEDSERQGDELVFPKPYQRFANLDFRTHHVAVLIR